MTTVVDPAGSPSVTFNREGTSIVTVTPGTGGSGRAYANPITSYSQRTMVLVPYTAGNANLLLPTSPQVGDEVMVVTETSSGNRNTVYVFTPTGATVDGYAGFTAANVAWFMCVGSNAWVALIGTSNQG